MHEIEAQDNIVMHQKPAWHGLGTIVEDAPTPTEALRIAGLDWYVEGRALQTVEPAGHAGGEPEPILIPSHQALIRSDTKTCLGVVGQAYEPIQNDSLAAFSESLADLGDTVKVESAGSIRNGRRVWFLLKGESFSVRGDDEHAPYILVSNGHDGTAAMRCTPTTVRVVCSNTLHMVLPGSEGGRIQSGKSGYAVRHVGRIDRKIEEARAALNLYGRSLDRTKELIGSLAAKDVKPQEIQSFWVDVYQRLQAPIPSNPTHAGEKMQRTSAEKAMAWMASRFDLEQQAVGAQPSAYLAFNAFTGWLQHDRPVTGQSADQRDEQRVYNRVFGQAADKTHGALVLAAKTFL